MKRIIFLLLFVFFLYSQAVPLDKELKMQIVNFFEKAYLDTDKSQINTALENYINNANKEIITGVTAVLQHEKFSQNKDKENHALALFLYLIKKGKYRTGDSITLAIAYANSYLYSIADKKTKSLLLKDIIQFYDLYIEIDTFQKKQSYNYTLSESGFAGKVCWATRFYFISNIWNDMYKEEPYLLTEDTYTEYVIQPAIISYIRQIIIKENLCTENIKRTANLLEYHVGSHLADEKKMKEKQEWSEKIYKGVKRKYSDFNWLNYQIKLLKEKGIIKGFCPAVTTVQLGFYKAAGIPAVGLQWINKNLAHNSPMYFDPELRRWMVVQLPWYTASNEKEKTEKEKISTQFYYTRSAWHPWQKIVVCYEEYAPLRNVINYYKLGETEDNFSSYYFSEMDKTTNIIFNESNAPWTIPDTDQDGVFDVIEKSIGTSISNWDTDNDSVSDLYEIEHGLNPLIPEKKPIIAVDGYTPELKKYADSFVIVEDPRGDNKDNKTVFDIKSAGVCIKNDMLYICVEFTITSNPLMQYSMTLCFMKIQKMGRLYILLGILRAIIS